MEKGTEAEKFVYDLSKDKLLEGYCLLNPFIKDSDNKEVCDLLIIGKETCLIVSVKNYSFTGNIDRFEKKVFIKSKEQLLGAKRRLVSKEKTMLIGKNEKAWELDLSIIKDFVLITLNFGHELEEYRIIEREGEAIIHNLDRDSFETILFEIDSVPEIVEYFVKKEAFLKRNHSTTLIGKEKDLLATFVSNKREFPKEWLEHENIAMTLDIGGKWDHYDKSEQVKAKRGANKLSYFIDGLVKNEIAEIPQCKLIGDYLMSLNRTERRLLAYAFFTQRNKNKAKTTEFLHRSLLLHTFKDASCLLLNYHSTFEEIMLDEYIKVTGEIYLFRSYPEVKKLIVIGSPQKTMTPFKFMYIERTEDYSEGQIQYYKDVIKKFGWFTEEKISNFGTKEYPTGA